jgi:hypothetical protein
VWLGLEEKRIPKSHRSLGRVCVETCVPKYLRDSVGDFISESDSVTISPQTQRPTTSAKSHVSWVGWGKPLVHTCEETCVPKYLRTSVGDFRPESNPWKILSSLLLGSLDLCLDLLIHQILIHWNSMDYVSCGSTINNTSPLFVYHLSLFHPYSSTSRTPSIREP